jgi:putative ABC transport system permease protein
MWFLTFVVKNVLRRPLRSVLTVTAIATAIGCVVALVGVANGFESAFLRLYETVGVDLVVVRTGRAAQRLNSSLDEAFGDKIKQIPGVKDVIPGLNDVVAVEDQNFVSLQGLVPETVVFDHMHIIQGRTLTRADQRAAIIGEVLAQNLGKGAGDTVEVIEKETFTIVGVFESKNMIEKGSLVLPLHELQRVMDRPGQVTGFSVILDPNQDVPAVRERIEALGKGIKAMPMRCLLYTSPSPRDRG